VKTFLIAFFTLYCAAMVAEQFLYGCLAVRIVLGSAVAFLPVILIQVL
jgi:hypothetical protein